MKHGSNNKPNTAPSPRQGLQNLLSQAVAAHQTGNIQQAQALYQQILDHDPKHPDALHLMGVIALGIGRLDIAEKLIRQAIQGNPKAAIFHNNLGNAMKGQGKFDEAIHHYQQALKLKRSYPEALNNLGAVLLEQGKPQQAAKQLRHALRFKPDYPMALNNLGNALKQQNDLEAAVDAYRQALRLNPNDGNIYCNLAAALQDLGCMDQAVELFIRSLQLNPQNVPAYISLGLIFKRQGKAREAIPWYQQALRLDPDNKEAHLNYALALLVSGSLEKGWREYEWRLEHDELKKRKRFPQPWWNGEDLVGKVLLIWGEQGLGDEILFANVIPDALSAAAHCVVECDQRLVPLFTRSFPRAEVIPRSQPHHPRASQPDIDLQTPAGGLCRWFRGDLESFSGRKGYLLADPDRIAFWKARLTALGEGLKVGICWRSMMSSGARNKAYTELAQWGPILAVPGAVFVNLQYDNCGDELAAAHRQSGTVVHQWNDIDLFNDLDDAAALTSALDLVISPATSVAAMAGALGVPVWQLSPPDNWPTLGTGRMPWYPGMRVFFQADGEPWEAVIERITEALRSLAGGSG